MKTLWTFGDCFTDSFLPPKNSSEHWRHKYIKWKGYVPKFYGEIISEELNLKLINKGVGGIDNGQIFEDFCSVVDLIGEDDVLIFGWTNQETTRLATNNNEWGHLCVNFRFKDKTVQEGDSHFFSIKKFNEVFDSISKRTIQEIMFNRTNFIYTKEVINWVKLINHTYKNNKIIHWSWDDRFKDFGIIYLDGYDSIKKETNGEINDWHWCEQAHVDIANSFIEIINNGEIIKTKTLI